ncbi:MAG TPA: phosphoenolpyruvate--protein phosphotransferase, partial [Betaproteobacteria bacterium]|nr:phosphoenolpyruvate--protein phosphotransferase [Betaproteobacteria bacterium]
MSFTMHGVGVSSGIAIGYAHLISHEMTDVVHITLPATAILQEIDRFEQAVQVVRDELAQLRASIPASAPAEVGAFLGVHHMILNDAMLAEAPKELIQSQHCNAEWALKQQMDSLLAQFDEIEDDYLRERKFDITQVVERVLKALLGRPGQLGETPREHSILVAHDLSPADMILFKQNRFAAFITDVGGATSHTAILARSLNIPSIVALHQARQLIREHDQLIIDGGQGVVIVNPDGQILQEYRLRQNQLELERQKLK